MAITSGFIPMAANTSLMSGHFHARFRRGKQFGAKKSNSCTVTGPVAGSA